MVPVIIDGQCHCGNITFRLDWPGPASAIIARECDCSFCVKHGGAWTSHPGATLQVRLHQPDAVSKYVFGTGTASFYVCARCGAVPLVTSDIAGRRYAVVNVNTFQDPDPSLVRREAAHFGQEATPSRLERRQRHWIADVQIG